MAKVDICPRCGTISELDALSREDNETMICASCGTDEALREFIGDKMPLSDWYKSQVTTFIKKVDD